MVVPFLRSLFFAILTRRMKSIRPSRRPDPPTVPLLYSILLALFYDSTLLLPDCSCVSISHSSIASNPFSSAVVKLIPNYHLFTASSLTLRDSDTYWVPASINFRPYGEPCRRCQRVTGYRWHPHAQFRTQLVMVIDLKPPPFLQAIRNRHTICFYGSIDLKTCHSRLAPPANG